VNKLKNLQVFVKKKPGGGENNTKKEARPCGLKEGNEE